MLIPILLSCLSSSASPDREGRCAISCRSITAPPPPHTLTPAAHFLGSRPPTGTSPAVAVVKCDRARKNSVFPPVRPNANVKSKREDTAGEGALHQATYGQHVSKREGPRTPSDAGLRTFYTIACSLNNNAGGQAAVPARIPEGVARPTAERQRHFQTCDEQILVRLFLG